LQPNFLRPFQGDTSISQKLSCTWRKIGCAFGLLTKHIGIFQKPFETNVEVTDCTIKSACVVYIYIRKTQATEVKRNEEDILEQEEQNVTASFEHAACFGDPSTEALQVR
jgi:ribosomal protein S17E